ncbi:MAG: GNVR domain-containing protein [Nitrospiraceae bacterium]
MLTDKDLLPPVALHPLMETGYGLREHLATVFRHKALIRGMLVGAILIAGPGSFLLTKVYSTDVRFLIQSNRTPFSVGAALTGPTYSAMDFSQKDEVATEVQIFTSPVLLDKLVETLGEDRVLAGMRGRWDWVLELPRKAIDGVIGFGPLPSLLENFGISRAPEHRHDQATQAIRDHLSVEPVRQTHVFVASLDSPHPQFAADALNALATIYLDHHLTVRKGKGAHEFFDEQTERLRVELHEAEKRLQSFKERWNIVALDDQKRHLLEQVTRAEAALKEAQVVVAESDVRVARLRDRLNMQQEAIPLTNVSERNPVLDQLKARLAQLELEQAQYVSDSPAVSEIKRELIALRARIQSESAKVTGPVTSGVNPAYQDLKKQLTLEEGRRDGMRPRVNELTKQVASYRETLNNLDQRELELRELMRAAKVKQEAFDLYLKKEEESRINEVLDRKGISNVTLFQPASVPTKAVRPRKALNLFLGLCAGLIAGVGSAYALDYVRRSMATREDAERMLRRPVLGALPFNSKGKAHREPGFTLQLRRITQHIARNYYERGYRTLLVTSTMKGEGCSTIATALAQMLSEENLRVLLLSSVEPPPLTVSPSVSEEQPSASPSHELAPSTIVQDGRSPHHLAHLRVTEHGTSTLGYANKLTEAAKHYQSQYDFVVIDGPPLSSFPEGRLVVSRVDVTILVVEAERTSAEAARQSLAAIDEADGRLAGIVLNKCRHVIPAWIYDRWLAGN